MIFSFLICIYLFFANLLHPGQKPSTDSGDTSIQASGDASGLSLSAAYGFSAGKLSSQPLTSLPVLPQREPRLTHKSIYRLAGSLDMEPEKPLDADVLPDFDMRKIKLKTTYFPSNNSLLHVPLIDNRETILALAKISSNAYINIDEDERDGFWYEVDPFLHENGFGWDEAAIRGYVYANPEKTLVIMAIKGTSTAIFDGSGHTVAADKFNDNLMFSCCCARVDVFWDTVCPCFEKDNNCDQECLFEYARRTRSFPFKKNITIAIDGETKKGPIEVTSIYPVYYYQAIKIYKQLREDYPRATIWLTGHSLGGSLASLLAMTFPGTSAVAFSAPGERLFAERLGLIPRQTKENQKEVELFMEQLPIFHIYNTADPIPYGRCSGIWSLCYIAGYALESKCHVGRVCEYDLGKGKPFDVQKHKLSFLINKVILADDYPPPTCQLQTDCFDCEHWNFV